MGYAASLLLIFDYESMFYCGIFVFVFIGASLAVAWQL